MTTPSAPALTDRQITTDLMTRLEAHYLKPSDRLPSGVFLPEAGWNGTANTRRVDALYIGFTSASSRLLVGHEVKASRSDWLNELRQIDKADAWADQCHQWWLVTVPGVVRDGELPADWGLMLPGTSRTRMKVAVPARTFTDRVPSWDTCRSMIARLNTVHRDKIAGQLEADRLAQNAAWHDQVEREVARRLPHTDHPDVSKAALTRLETALGGHLGDWAGAGQFTEAELRLAGRWLEARRDLDMARRRLSTPYARRQMSDDLTRVGEAITALKVLDDSIAELLADTKDVA